MGLSFYIKLGTNLHDCLFAAGNSAAIFYMQAYFYKHLPLCKKTPEWDGSFS